MPRSSRALFFSALVVPFSAFGAALAQAPQPTAPVAPVAPAAMNSIVAKDLMAHATFLASDELGGRLTGSKGQLAAAK